MSGELIPAFVAALAELTVVEKAHRANAGSYSYSFADLGDLVELTRPVLASHGLAAITPIEGRGDGLCVVVVILHTSGERMDLGRFPFPQGRDAQATGSMVTYHRRYALLAALGMATREDDDGAAAVPVERHTGGYRTSLKAAVDKLDDAEREKLRAWLAEMGIPNPPETEDQCERTVDWLIHGMPGEGDYG